MSVAVPVNERRELLLGMYQENRCQARHYQATRATVVSFTLAAALAIAGLIANHGFTLKDWPLVVVMVVIGVYGTFFTVYYFKLIDRYEQLAIEFCEELDRLFGTDELVKKPRTLKEIEDDAMGQFHDKFASWRGLERGELFRMYWPLTISLLAASAMLLKLTVSWIL